MPKRFKIAVLLIIAASLCLAGFAGAQDIKARMQARHAQIADLKARGIVGENNHGYLEFLPGKKENPVLLADENSDRRTVYEAIARKTGATAQLVGQRRALQIAEKAQAGEWLQAADGKWHTK